MSSYSAPGSSGAWQVIGKTILGANAASIDFSSIATGYKFLKLTIVAEGAAADVLLVRVNNDNANMSHENLQGSGAVPTSAGSNPTGAYCGSVATDKFSIFEIVFQNTTINVSKGYASHGGQNVTTHAGGGYWTIANTEITRLTVLLSGGNNLITGSSVLLEGATLA